MIALAMSTTSGPVARPRAVALIIAPPTPETMPKNAARNTIAPRLRTHCSRGGGGRDQHRHHQDHADELQPDHDGDRHHHSECSFKRDHGKALGAGIIGIE